MSGGSGPRLSYNASLDGVRAFAVLAVIAVHQQFTWLPGGYYGVDAFFVLSGFLITSLLVKEWEGTGGIALRRFWARRARRLLPALFVLLIAIGMVAAAWPDVLGAPHLFANSLATLFYSANWYFVAQHTSYFSPTQQSPLLHTWSLAIEEQFYLVWPLVVLAVLRWRPHWAGRRAPEADRGRRLRMLLALSIAGALASAAVMAALSPVGTVSNRAYYGTDTRAQGLLVGAAVAIAFTLWRPQWRWSRALFGALAIAGAAGTAAIWVLVPETSALAFHGGFLLAALATAAVVAGAVQSPASPVPRALATAPLRALGRISYGVYLWYWPVLLVVDGERTHLQGFSLFVLRVAVTVAIATLSYHLVEQPIRRGALPSWRGAVAVPLAAGAALLAMAATTLVPDASASAPVRARAAAEVTSDARAADSSSYPALDGDHTGRPVKVLLVGDSAAGSLGVGLAAEAPRYGVQLVNEGAPGCSLAMDQQFKVLWYTIEPGPPCVAGDPAALLDRWRQWVDAYNPDVVVYLARGELFDQEVGGSWTNIGSPGFDHYLEARFAQAVSVLSARGAAVLFLTTPTYDSGEQPSGAPWPEDAPSRAAFDNALIRQVAASATHDRASGRAPSSPRVAVFDLGALLSPGGRYLSAVDGVDLRCSDGVHFTSSAGEWVASRLFPEVVALGIHHAVTSPAGQWPGSLPPAVPAWWWKLPCG